MILRDNFYSRFIYAGWVPDSGEGFQAQGWVPDNGEDFVAPNGDSITWKGNNSWQPDQGSDFKPVEWNIDDPQTWDNATVEFRPQEYNPDVGGYFRPPEPTFRANDPESQFQEIEFKEGQNWRPNNEQDFRLGWNPEPPQEISPGEWKPDAPEDFQDDYYMNQANYNQAIPQQDMRGQQNQTSENSRQNPSKSRPQGIQWKSGTETDFQDNQRNRIAQNSQTQNQRGTSGVYNQTNNSEQNFLAGQWRPDRAESFQFNPNQPYTRSQSQFGPQSANSAERVINRDNLSQQGKAWIPDKDTDFRPEFQFQGRDWVPDSPQNFQAGNWKPDGDQEFEPNQTSNILLPRAKEGQNLQQERQPSTRQSFQGKSNQDGSNNTVDKIQEWQPDSPEDFQPKLPNFDKSSLQQNTALKQNILKRQSQADSGISTGPSFQKGTNPQRRSMGNISQNRPSVKEIEMKNLRPRAESLQVEFSQSNDKGGKERNRSISFAQFQDVNAQSSPRKSVVSSRSPEENNLRSNQGRNSRISLMGNEDKSQGLKSPSNNNRDNLPSKNRESIHSPYRNRQVSIQMPSASLRERSKSDFLPSNDKVREERNAIDHSEFEPEKGQDKMESEEKTSGLNDLNSSSFPDQEIPSRNLKTIPSTKSSSFFLTDKSGKATQSTETQGIRRQSVETHSMTPTNNASKIEIQDSHSEPVEVQDASEMDQFSGRVLYHIQGLSGICLLGIDFNENKLAKLLA